MQAAGFLERGPRRYYCGVAEDPIELTSDQLAEAAERWPDESEGEQRRRMMLSIRAKAKHEIIADPATGRRVFGGPQPNSGRKSKKRAAETIADLAQGDRQKEVIDALFSGLAPSEDAAVRVRTAAKIVEIERDERELQLREDEFTGMPKDELQRLLANGLARMIERGEITDPREALREARQGYDVDGTVAA